MPKRKKASSVSSVAPSISYKPRWVLNDEGRYQVKLETGILSALLIEREDKRFKSTLGSDEIIFYSRIVPKRDYGDFVMEAGSFNIFSFEKLLYQVSERAFSFNSLFRPSRWLTFAKQSPRAT